MSKVDEYWDVCGLITADCDPQQEYDGYLSVFGRGAPSEDIEGMTLTLQDFQAHIEQLAENKQ